MVSRRRRRPGILTISGQKWTRMARVPVPVPAGACGLAGTDVFPCHGKAVSGYLSCIGTLASRETERLSDIHITRELLRALERGELSERTLAEMELQHLESLCPFCRQEIRA